MVLNFQITLKLAMMAQSRACAPKMVPQQTFASSLLLDRIPQASHAQTLALWMRQLALTIAMALENGTQQKQVEKLPVLHAHAEVSMVLLRNLSIALVH
jgi:hypothetical protein